MNLELFDEFMTKENRPSQDRSEWQIFLEICEMYLERHKIENPIAVELGTWRNKQKKFYEELLGARHIGINISERRGRPDICGNTHDPNTREMLKEKLKGRPINILFIDAGHYYKDVKEDFEMYSPLCSDIIAFHDIETSRYINIRENMGVWKFWDELRTMGEEDKEEYKDLFLSIQGRRNYMGIGMIIKR